MACGCGGTITLNSWGCCCSCGELPAVREEGPPGPAGPDGGIPVFEVGSVSTGSPSVTITQVTPLLYTIDFVLPNVPTSTPNTWSDTQTFTVQAIFNGGLQSNGNVGITGDLSVSGTSTLSGDVSIGGILAVNGNTTLANATVTNDLGIGGNLTVGGNSIFTGTVSFTIPPDLGIIALTANQNVRGYLVLDHNNDIKFVAGYGYTSRGQAAATGLADVPPLSGGIAICDPLVVTVPVLTPNQPLPIIDLEFTVVIEPSGSVDDFTLSLWQGVIGVGSAIDFWDFATPGTDSKQITLRKCNVQLVLGANTFNVGGDNNSAGVTVNVTKAVWRVRN